MIRATVVFVLAALGAFAWFQVESQGVRPLAEIVPGNALFYVEAKDFSRLLQLWNTSEQKAKWLQSDNFETFQRSNLFLKLAGVEKEFAESAGVHASDSIVSALAGKESAIALYDFREVEFLYVSRIGSDQVTKSAVWNLRSQFEERQAGGSAFYISTKGGRTVAFAYVKGLLFLGTREDLVAHSLELLAGQKGQPVSDDPWFLQSAKAAKQAGDLRLVLNLEKMIATPAFRSYWVQRNVSALKKYSAGISDFRLGVNPLVEDRVFIRLAGTGIKPVVEVQNGMNELLRLAPENAGLFKAWVNPSTNEVAELLEDKILAPRAKGEQERRYAPEASSAGGADGNEAELEVRIDEPPLSEKSADLRPLDEMVAANPPAAVLEVQSSRVQPGSIFVQLPSAVAVWGASDWNQQAVLSTLQGVVSVLWTTGGSGIEWQQKTEAGQSYWKLGGLAGTAMAVKGKLLIIATDEEAIKPLLGRFAAPVAKTDAVVFEGEFRHKREVGSFTALFNDVEALNQNGPRFFAGNLASLSGVLSNVEAVRRTVWERGGSVEERVEYSTAK